ncbi:MAG: T9SS type A sorting domain-containing protein [Bacteroidia bacterium]|nr:T9SS type A sorting domain-containing protein [Bacteroidia bacterium]
MKKHILFLFLITSFTSYAQLLLNEDFDYNSGSLTDIKGRNNVSFGNWFSVSTSSFFKGDQFVSAGNLTYPNYFSNIISNKLSVTFDSAGAYSYRLFEPQFSGTVYFSFLLNVENLTTNNPNNSKYFIEITDSLTKSWLLNIDKGINDSFFKLKIQDDYSGNKNFVLSNDLAINKTHLIVIAYQFNNGNENDSIFLWVNQNAIQKPKPNYSIGVDSTNKCSNLVRFMIHNLPDLAKIKIDYDLDALHIGKTWEDIMGTPEYNIAQINTSNASTGIADSVGVKVKLKGIVHRYNQTSIGLKFLLHDGTGGITVFSTSKTFGYTVGEGDSIEVTGIINSQKGLVIINIDTLILISQFNLTRTPTTAIKLGENTENKLITIANLKFINKQTNNWNVGTYNTIIRNTNDTVTILILPTSPLVGKKAPTNNWFNATGIGTQISTSFVSPFAFNGYSIIPMKLSDIVIGDSITSLVEVTTKNKISIYPNPATSKLTVNSETAIKEIYIYDVLGKLVKQINVEKNKTKETEITIDDLNTGIYIIQVVDVFDAKLSSKFIKEQ